VGLATDIEGEHKDRMRGDNKVRRTRDAIAGSVPGGPDQFEVTIGIMLGSGGQSVTQPDESSSLAFGVRSWSSMRYAQKLRHGDQDWSGHLKRRDLYPMWRALV
jgi:hypothetical protein